MSKPEYFSKKKFDDIAKMDAGVLTDDYVHNSNETWKFKATSKQYGSSFDYKSVTSFFNKEKTSPSKMSDEVALSFPLGSRFWMKIDSNSKGDLKLHLDGGKLTCKKTGKEINVWAGIDTLKDHSKFSFKFGANYWGNLWDICTRISSSPADDCKLCFSEKIVRRFGNFFIGGYHCQSILPSCLTCRHDCIMGYDTQKGLKLYLRQLSPSPCCPKKDEKKEQKQETGKCCCCLPKLGNVLGTAIFKKGKVGLGLELSYNFAQKAHNAVAGVEYEIDANKKVKAKFDLARNLSIAGKLKFNDRFNVKTAVNVPVKKEEWKKISYGIEWELTI